jgi:hypothetical protein
MIRAICDPLEVQRKVRLFPTEMIKGLSLEKATSELNFEGQAAYGYPGILCKAGQRSVPGGRNMGTKAEKHGVCATNSKGVSWVPGTQCRKRHGTKN